MPLFSGSQIVGGGANLIGVTVGNIPRVVDVGPPGALSDSVLRQWADGAVQVITVGAVNVGAAAAETFRLAGGFISAGVGTDSTIIGRGAAAGGGDAIAIGRGATAAGSPAIAIGAVASAPANSTISIGNSTVITNASNAVVIGHSANAASNGGSPNLIAIGNSASAGRSVGGCIALAIGSSAVARENDVVIGHQASSSAATTANFNTIVGNQGVCNVSGSASTLVGANNTITAGNRTSILGGGNSSSQGQCILLGSGITNTTANTGYFGGSLTDITLLIIGAGQTIATPAARTIRFTNGTGTNNVASAVTIQAPLSTGNAASAVISFTAGIPQASGATTHVALELLRVSHTAVAGQTGVLIYDVNTGIMQRVLVGAVGTGPGGANRALYLV